MIRGLEGNNYSPVLQENVVKWEKGFFTPFKGEKNWRTQKYCQPILKEKEFGKGGWGKLFLRKLKKKWKFEGEKLSQP